MLGPCDIYNRFSMKLLYKSTDGAQSIYFQEQHQIIFAQSKGTVRHEDYKKSSEVAFEAVREYQGMKLMYELSEMNKTEMVSRAWFTTPNLPQLLKTYGSDFSAAVVRSENMFENTSSELLAKGAMKLGFKGNIAFFDSNAEAEAWLVNQGVEVAA